MDYYRNKKPILLAVDCIIFGFDLESIKLLVFNREVEPFQGHWSLLGSFVNPDELVSNAAGRVVEECTGLNEIYLEELQTYSDLSRDPGARVISIAHYALIPIDDNNQKSVEKFGARWFNFEDLPELIFDHRQMVEDAFEKLRRKARYRPLGFELLPEKFTIPQLKKLYDLIYRKELDRANFRKKILSMNILEKLNEKDKSSSKKGAYFYRFIPERYDKLIEEGIDFKL